MRRGVLALVALAVVAAGCSDGADATTTTAVTVTTAAPETTSPPPTTAAPETSVATSSTDAPVETTTTTEPAVPLPAAPLIVANDDGVFRFGDDGSVTELVSGPVVVAVDDTRGGIFLQTRRGRFGPGDDSTIVWWIRARSDTAEAFLVPSQPDHFLSLHDAVATAGVLSVYYTRAEGGNPDDMVDTLRRYDAEARTVTELGGIGGWEAGSDPISIGGDTIAMTWYAEILNGFAFWDLDGNDTAFPADPFGGDFCEDRRCQWSIELAPDGDTFAFFQQVEDDQGFLANTDLVVAESGTGRELARVLIRTEQQGWFPQSIDLHGNLAVVNRESISRDGYLEPWVVEFGGSAPTIFEVPITGTARVLRAPIEIAAPVAAPRP